MFLRPTAFRTTAFGNFVASTQNPPIWAPRQKLCASFPGKERKNRTHINFFGRIFGVENGVPNGPIFGRKKFSLVFFPALRKCWTLRSGVRKRVVFQRAGFGGCSPRTETGAREGTWTIFPRLELFLEGSSKEVLLGRVLRRRLVRALIETEVLRRVLRRGGFY